MLKRTKKSDDRADKGERIAWSKSLNADDLDFLQQKAEAVGLYRSPDLEYGFISKDVNGPAQKHGTSIIFRELKTNTGETNSAQTISLIGIDEDLLLEQHDTVNSKMIGEMGENNKAYKKFKHSRNNESIYDKRYKWTPSNRSKIRERLNEKRKHRESNSILLADVKGPSTPTKNHPPYVGENHPSSTPSPEHSYGSEHSANITPDNLGSGHSIAMLDWAYLSDNSDQQMMN